MKIDKKLIKELVDHLSEFNLTELEYQEGQTKIKVSKASKGIEQIKSGAVVSPNKAVLNESDESDVSPLELAATRAFFHASKSPRYCFHSAANWSRKGRFSSSLAARHSAAIRAGSPPPIAVRPFALLAFAK